MANYCSQCGTPLPSLEAKFCPSCGASISTAVGPQAALPQPQPPDPARGVVRGAATLFLIIISTTISVIIFFAVYLFLVLATYDFETSALIALMAGGITFLAGVGYAIQRTRDASDGGDSGRMFGRAVNILFCLALLGAIYVNLTGGGGLSFLAMLVFGALVFLTRKWGE